MMAQSHVSAGGGGCDPQSALMRLGDDRDLYREVLQRFFAEAAGFVDRISAAADTSRAEDLHRSAHSFKGLAAMAGAEEAARIAADLEALGKAKQFDGAPELVARLQRELQSARTLLAPYFESQSA